MRRYVLIAGVNGAGKSTLYQTLDSLQNMKRINTDEIELHYVGVESVDIAKKRIAYPFIQK
jgi:ABC-type cobalamin/Fe3+-siderophores transport system ATPase subunit